MANDDISFKLGVDTSDAEAGLRKFQESANKAFGIVTKESGGLGNALKGVSTGTSQLDNVMSTFAGVTLAGIALKALSAVTDAAIKFGEALVVEGTAAAIQTQDAIIGMNSALVLNGSYTKEAADQLEEYAGSLQKTTKFSDDQVLATEALIATYSSLDKDGIQKATKAALDFSTAFRVDVDTAARLVGKAAEGNIDAFKKYGISIKDTGNIAENFSKILEKVANKVDGSSEAAAKSFSGQTTILKNNFEDFQKSVGNIIINNQAVISSIGALNDIVFKLQKYVVDNKDAINEFISRLAFFTKNIVVGTVEGLGTLGKGFSSLTELLNQNTGAFQNRSKLSKQLIEDEKVSVKSLTAGHADEIVSVNSVNEAISKIAINRKLNTEDEAVFLAKINEDRQKVHDAELNRLQKEQDARQAQSLKDIELHDKRVKQDADDITAAIDRSETLRALDAQKYAEQIALNEQFVITKQEQLAQDLAADVAALENRNAVLSEIKAADRSEEQNREIESNNFKIQNAKRSADEQTKIDKKLSDLKKAELNARLSQAGQFFGNLATLTQTGNRDLFAIGKVSALAQSVISGATAINNALAVQPYPVGVALAASAAIAAGVQIATISAQELATGITEVPPGFEGDRYPALLSSGERVLSVDQNRDLKDFINSKKDDSGSSISAGILASIDAKLTAALNRPIVLTINGKEIFRSVDDQLRGGRLFSV